MANEIKLGDFSTIENKTLCEKEIFRRIKPVVGSWRARCYEKPLRAPYKTASFRSVVYPKISDTKDYKLTEGVIGASKGKLTYVEQTMTVEPYGFYATYTDQDMTYGFDDIVADLTDSVSNQAEQLLDKMAFDTWVKGNNVWNITGTTSAKAKLDRETFMKIRIALSKVGKRGAKVVAILTPEDIAQLRLDNAELFRDTTLNEDAVKNGVVGRFEGVDIIEDSAEGMYHHEDATTGDNAKAEVNIRYAFFYITDQEGRLPVAFIKADGEVGEFIAKGLGASGTADPLNQIGSIGVKFKGLGAMITAEDCLVRVELKDYFVFDKVKGEVDYDNVKYEIGAQGKKDILVGGTKKTSPSA